MTKFAKRPNIVAFTLLLIANTILLNDNINDSLAVGLLAFTMIGYLLVIVANLHPLLLRIGNREERVYAGMAGACLVSLLILRDLGRTSLYVCAIICASGLLLALLNWKLRDTE